MPAPALINGRYEINEKPIGHGGMGVVYKAYDQVTKRNVALKTMRGIVEPAALELFSREWTVLAKLSHPNIVDILDCGEFQEEGQRKPFFVMPLLPGVTLEYLIQHASQRLTVERTAELMAQTCRGLQAAHEQGLVHRDLKPSNIFVLDDDTVKVIDFGVVHLTGAQSITGLKGTLQYMSPEQTELKPATAVSDIFSLGVVCYEALTRRKPFARKSENETADAVRNHIPPPINEINTSISQLVSRVVHKAMAKQPWHRFSSARDFADTLQRAVNNQPIERFDPVHLKPRIERAKRAQAEGDYQFAREILNELDAEGNTDPEMTVLRIQNEQAIRQKSIRQLLDSSRTRLEEEEYPLALQKIQEVLDIDPHNADALTLKSEVEKLRSKMQIENWFRLVRQHIENHSFSQARQGLEQILKISAGDTQARELLAEVDRRESEIAKLRSEKEQLYQSAVGSYQNGEISSALSKLERILDLNRRSPDSSAPERDAHYQTLYNQVRSEREAARNSYAEGRRHLADRNFGKALETCEGFLKKYPADPMFQALKLEVEEQQRQEQSAYIAEISRRVEGEADLDRRVDILREAVGRYPNEPHFQQTLRLIRERRDLVNSIVGRARQYEEHGQFNEGLGQWDILRNIYPKYPGLEFEVQRVMRRREDQAREESKARWVEQIDRHIETGGYLRAIELARNALADFPEDRELTGLERIAKQGLERSAEAQKWLEQGQGLCLDRQFAEGLQALRKAGDLDPRNPVIRAALLNALVEQARSVLGQDWRAAEPLVQQALQMDPANPLAKSLQALVTDYKRQEIVNESVAQAREYQVTGDLTAALAKVEEVLATWPNEVRLVQLRSTLRHQLGEQQRPAVVPVSDPAPAEPKVMAGGTAADDSLLSIDASLDRPHYDRSTAAVGAVDPTRTEGLAGAPPPNPPDVKQPIAFRSAGIPQKLRQARALAAVRWGKAALQLREFGHPTAHWSRLQWAVVAAVPVLLLAGLLFSRSHRSVQAPPVPVYTIDFECNVIGARYAVDGQPVTGLPKLREGPHRAEASLAGYHSDTKSFTLSPGIPAPYIVHFRLEPELPHLRLISDLRSGSIVLDGQPPVNLQDGGFARENLPAGDHILQLVDGSRELIQLAFKVDPGGLVSLSAPVQTKDLSVVVVSSLASRARIYGNNSLKANLPEQLLQPVPPEGLDLGNLTSSNTRLALDDGSGPRQLPIEVGNTPLLSVFVNGDPNVGTLVIQSNVPDARIVVDGQPRKQPLRNGKASLSLEAGTHFIRVTKAGFQDFPDRKVEIKKGATQVERMELKAPVDNASLLIQEATPDAEVWIDGSHAGATDASGAYSQTNISPGAHTISLRKQNFEDVVFHETAAGGETIRLTAYLRPLGSMLFRMTPASVQITYKREGETLSHEGKNNESIRLMAGRYEVSAHADRYKARSETVTVSASAQLILDWGLLVLPPEKKTVARVWTTADYFEDTPHWKQVGERWAHDAPDTSWLRASRGVFVFDIFKQSSKRFFGNKRVKRVEWVIDYKSEEDRIIYWLDERTLHRKQVVDGKGQEEKRPLSFGNAESCRLEIEIQPDRVAIRNGGRTLDQIKRDPANGLGKFGFKGDVTLAVLQAPPK